MVGSSLLRHCPAREDKRQQSAWAGYIKDSAWWLQRTSIESEALRSAGDTGLVLAVEEGAGSQSDETRHCHQHRYVVNTIPPSPKSSTYVIRFRLVFQVKIAISQISEGRRRKNSSLQFISGQILRSPITVASAKAPRGNSQAWMGHITEMDLLITESGQELGRANVQAIVWLGRRLFPRTRPAAAEER